MAKTMTAWIMERPGLTGTAPDRWNQYLTAQGHTTGTMNDRMYSWLSVTYTGNLQEVVRQWSDATLS